MSTKSQTPEEPAPEEPPAEPAPDEGEPVSPAEDQERRIARAEQNLEGSQG